jgi:hypothetical protein
MVPITFRTIRERLTAYWVVSGEGELVGYSLDIVKDAFVERLRLGHLARFPENGPNGETSADDALAALGRDRGLIRGIGEVSTTYARRLKSWIDDRKRQGNPFELMKQLAAYCGPLPAFRTVDQRGNWYSRAANGTESFSLNTGNWDWDGLDLSHWSRFWVIIYPNGLWTTSPDNYGDSGAIWNHGVVVGDGVYRTWGTSATPNEVTNVRAIIDEWKPAGTRCVNIIIAFDNASFNPSTPEPDGLWGNWSKVVGGVRVPSRLSTARYWAGV